MADKDAFKERSRELFREHEEFEDLTLFYTFRNFLTDFEFFGYEKMLAGELTEKQLAQIGIETDVKMSEEGLAKLRHAFLFEADEWTEDLRQKEKVLEQLCAQLDAGDVLALNRMLKKARNIWYSSKLRRYEILLESLSPHDSVALDAVFFNRKSGQMSFTPRMPVNADHIWDTLAVEFPDEVLEEAKRECEKYELNKGKHYKKVIETTTSDDSPADDSGKRVTSANIFRTIGYELVDE